MWWQVLSSASYIWTRNISFVHGKVSVILSVLSNTVTFLQEKQHLSHIDRQLPQLNADDYVMRFRAKNFNSLCFCHPPLLCSCSYCLWQLALKKNPSNSWPRWSRHQWTFPQKTGSLLASESQTRSTIYRLFHVIYSKKHNFVTVHDPWRDRTSITALHNSIYMLINSKQMQIYKVKRTLRSQHNDVYHHVLFGVLYKMTHLEWL